MINVGGLRIAALSGIYKANDYERGLWGFLLRLHAALSTCLTCSHMTGHYERVPYSASDLISVYHVRSFEVFQLYQVLFCV